ncbi:MAG: AlpA family phage regulatory protein [Candidatus Methanomethyliaceae archaeon]
MEFLRPKDVMQKMKVRRTYLYDLIRRGLFPRPVKLGTMSVWLADEVEKVMSAMYRGKKPEEIRSLVKTIEEMRPLEED